MINKENRKIFSDGISGIKRVVRTPKISSISIKRTTSLNEIKTNQDGIKNIERSVFIRIAQENKKNVPKKTFALLIRKRTYKRACRRPHYQIPILPPKAPSFTEATSSYSKRFITKRNLVFATLILMFCSFVGGMIAVVSENKIQADSVSISETATKTLSDKDLENFAKTTVKLLEQGSSHPAGPDQLITRKAKLRKYLQDKNSPFFEDDQALDSLLSLPHMKLILAISYAESTMGKNCYFYNCSGIGGYVPNLRKYKEFRNWMIDLNDLLERRYKDWSLQDMCGVYVQPCNPNWLKATNQVLNELNERDIN